MVDIVKDEELIKALNAEIAKKEIKKDFNIEGQIVTDEKTIDALNKIIIDKEKKIKEEPTWFENLIEKGAEIFTGNKRTEFPNMDEVYVIKSKNLAKDLGINIGFITNADPMAHLDMLTKAYPGTVISKDKHDNIMVTLPSNVVDGENRTFYLDKPGLTFNGAVNTLGQTLLYVPGAGWVIRNITTGTLKKITAQGVAASLTSAATDVISYGLGSEQGQGMIPVLEEGKAAMMLVAGAAGEKGGQFLSTWTGFNVAKNFLKSKIPSRFNVMSGSGIYFDNKGSITNKTIEAAKKLGTSDSVMKNKSLMLDFAKALESGLDAPTAANMVGLNEFGVSVWLAQASGNKKVLNKLQLMRDGAYGDDLQKIILAQDEKQLKQVFTYLTKYRNNLIKSKNITPLNAPPGTATANTRAIDDNLSEVSLLLKQTEKKMKDRVDAKYSAIKSSIKLSFNKPVLKNFTHWVNKDLLDVETGIGQALDKTLMPQSTIAIKQLNKFMSRLENKNLSKITIGMLETQRKGINQMMKNTQGVDKAALMVIKRRFDIFYDNAVEKGLASGSDDVLNAIKSARLEHTKFMKIFSPNNIIKNQVRQSDMGTKVIRNILDGDYSGTQIANWFYGTNSLGKNTQTQSIPTLKKLNTIFKEGSYGRQLIKDGAFLRIVENSFKKYGSREIFDPEKFAINVRNAFNGKGKDVSELLFSKKEMDTLIKFANKLEKDLPRKTFVHTENGANAFMNIWNSFWRSAVGIGGFQAFGIQGTLGGRFLYDALAKNSVKNAQLQEMQQAIIKLNLPTASGGAGLIDQAIEKRPILQSTDKSYKGNVIPDASTLEQLKKIQSLNAYR